MTNAAPIKDCTYWLALPCVGAYVLYDVAKIAVSKVCRCVREVFKAIAEWLKPRIIDSIYEIAVTITAGCKETIKAILHVRSCVWRPITEVLEKIPLHIYEIRSQSISGLTELNKIPDMLTRVIDLRLIRPVIHELGDLLISDIEGGSKELFKLGVHLFWEVETTSKLASEFIRMSVIEVFRYLGSGTQQAIQLLTLLQRNLRRTCKACGEMINNSAEALADLVLSGAKELNKGCRALYYEFRHLPRVLHSLFSAILCELWSYFKAGSASAKKLYTALTSETHPITHLIFNRIAIWWIPHRVKLLRLLDRILATMEERRRALFAKVSEIYSHVIAWFSPRQRAANL